MWPLMPLNKQQLSEKYLILSHFLTSVGKWPFAETTVSLESLDEDESWNVIFKSFQAKNEVEMFPLDAAYTTSWHLPQLHQR